MTGRLICSAEPIEDEVRRPGHLPDYHDAVPMALTAGLTEVGWQLPRPNANVDRGQFSFIRSERRGQRLPDAMPFGVGK